MGRRDPRGSGYQTQPVRDQNRTCCDKVVPKLPAVKAGDGEVSFIGGGGAAQTGITDMI
ncbi:hypothetical protein FH972_005366 [Carpinus fangiana]|uniref:Uncharacterized protein n=1 Tax=Carpinus fangiana TaxID=176857 RepID=A0A5N6QPZ3_9ROSI|nr:hypothetical protein FH972_005366 [Carpinus fangiana]